MFKPKSNSYKILVGVCSVAATVFAVYLFVFAGTIDSPAVPSDESGRMYTLDQIYHKINSGTVTAKQSVFTEPGSAPASTMHTLDNIYGDFTTDATACAGTTAADVLSGKTFFATSGTTRGADWGPVAGTYVPIKSLLPTTFQVLCYDTDGGAAIACNDAGWPDQDADVSGDSGACTPTYTQGTYTVTDSCTNLEWQRYGHASDDGYTVPAAAGDCDLYGGTYSASYCTYSWQNALKYCSGLSLDGHGDWRLPNIKELQSIVKYSIYNPSIDTTKFTNTGSDYYWSSTTYASYTSYAWLVYFTLGYVSYLDKTDSYYVRCVRQY